MGACTECVVWRTAFCVGLFAFLMVMALADASMKERRQACTALLADTDLKQSFLLMGARARVETVCAYYIPDSK